MDVVRWRPPTAQPLFPPEELEMISAFGPQYKPEDHWLANCGIQTMLDVGAHMGEFAQRIRTMLPNSELVCFEPLEEPFTKLTERFRGQPNFRAIRCALGEKAGQHEIHHKSLTFEAGRIEPMHVAPASFFELSVERDKKELREHTAAE